MKSYITKTWPALVLAFALTGCGDSSEEAALRPDLTGRIVRDSITRYTTGPVNAAEVEYEARLRTILDSTDMAALLTLQAHNIDVCMDQRMRFQNSGLMDREIIGVFVYNGRTGTVMLWDDGGKPTEGRMFQTDAYDYGSAVLEKLADRIDSEGLSSYTVMYAGRFMRRTGKSSRTVTEWRLAEDFDQDSIAKNPHLSTPPFKPAAPQP